MEVSLYLNMGRCFAQQQGDYRSQRNDMMEKSLKDFSKNELL
jgi:hypothetical protein